MRRRLLWMGSIAIATSACTVIATLDSHETSSASGDAAVGSSDAPMDAPPTDAAPSGPCATAILCENFDDREALSRWQINGDGSVELASGGRSAPNRLRTALSVVPDAALLPSAQISRTFQKLPHRVTAAFDFSMLPAGTNTGLLSVVFERGRVTVRLTMTGTTATLLAEWTTTPDGSHQSHQVGSFPATGWHDITLVFEYANGGPLDGGPHGDLAVSVAGQTYREPDGLVLPPHANEVHLELGLIATQYPAVLFADDVVIE